jgi:hypothetical protein
MATHVVEYVLRVVAEEMDGSPEATAEIIHGLLQNDINHGYAFDILKFECTKCWETDKWRD